MDCYQDEIIVSCDIKNHIPAKTLTFTIMNELNKFNIPDDIKKDAERIYHTLNYHIRRGRKRKKMIFYCIYNAFLEHDIIYDPYILADFIGLEANEVQKCFSMFIVDNYKPVLKKFHPKDFFPHYCKIFNINLDALPRLEKLCNEIINKDKSLLEMFPQTVSASILYYFLTINGITINKLEFCKKLKRSETFITKLYEKIASIHNSI